MNKDKFREVLKCVRCYACVLGKGILRALHGTAVVGLFVVAVLGFVLVAKDGGYAAVFDFIAACFILAVALLNAFLIGCEKRWVGK